MPNEQVLVVKTDLLKLPKNNYLAEQKSVQALLDACADNFLFMERPQAEGDPAYKQLIPYVTVIYNGTVMCLERTTAQSEARLHGKASLGVGGHINSGDNCSSMTGIITQAMARELREELWLETDNQPALMGLINDDSNSVGSVHLGLHYILHVDSKPRVRETDKMTASWLNSPQLEALRPRLETWSQILLPALLKAGHL